MTWCKCPIYRVSRNVCEHLSFSPPPGWRGAILQSWVLGPVVLISQKSKNIWNNHIRRFLRHGNQAIARGSEVYQALARASEVYRELGALPLLAGSLSSRHPVACPMGSTLPASSCLAGSASPPPPPPQVSGLSIQKNDRGFAY